MRTVLIALLTVAILTGCRGGSTSSITPLPSRSSTPPAVLRLADDYVASLAMQQTEVGGDLRGDFCHSFFQGFTIPGATMSGGTEAGRRGFLAGQEYRQAHPTNTKETMEGFGYTAVEVVGVWTVSFEHSGFCPDTQPKQTWWLSYFGDTQFDPPKDTKIPDSGVHIRVRGYLSPAGRFGHLGSYDHEIYATSISKIGG